MIREWRAYLKGWPDKPNEIITISDDHATYEFRGNPIKTISPSFAKWLLGSITVDRLAADSDIASIEYVERDE